MGFRSWLNNLLGRQETPAATEDLAREVEVKAQIQKRCTHFRHLLRANKRALEWIGDIEEHLAGKKIFGMRYLRSSSAEVVANVFQMIRALNVLSDNQYPGLVESFSRIRQSMSQEFAPAFPVHKAPFILPLGNVGLADLSQVGGKMANLGEIAAHVGLQVPSGFAITVSAFNYFMSHNDLGVELAKCIQSGEMDQVEGLLTLSQQLQQKILNATLPQDLRDEIEGAVAKLQDECGINVRLAVRSSAVGEDSLGASFAGQYRTEVNVHPEEVCDVWKEIIASKYSTSALSYRYQRGIPDDEAPMAVGVLAMVDALAGGVAYSRNPLGESLSQEQIVVNAVHGIPASVVDGRVTPDAFYCSHSNPPTLLSNTSVDPDKPVLSPSQACRVARVALALEEYYTEPQDVEWAINKDNLLVILQSRPLHRENSVNTEEENDMPQAVSPLLGAPLLEGGVPVSKGIAFGRTFVAQKEADMLAFPENAILVIARAHPRWAALLPHAAGLVSESGGIAGHLASVAREYGIPAIFSLPNACSLLNTSEEITLDANRSAIYAGDQRNLLPQPAEKPNFIPGSPIWHRLKNLAKHITPLHLLDPKAKSFAPEYCQSMHDLTRFCHEKAVEILFSGENSVDVNVGKQLKAGSKLQYWLVDMGGGFARQVKGPTVALSDIASRPMLALWEGMVSIPWNGPPIAGASGFMSIVLESTMKPELESTLANPMAERNFFIVGADYMILQARYGYHFCTVECQAGPQAHENFLSFQFKGGAADHDRRRLRLEFFAELLEHRNFKVDIKEDALFAVAEDFDAIQTLHLTRMLGYLLIHSRQSDIIMKDAERVALFRKKILRDLAHLDSQTLHLPM